MANLAVRRGREDCDRTIGAGERGVEKEACSYWTDLLHNGTVARY